MNDPSVPWYEWSNVYNKKETIGHKTKTLKASIDLS